ncbi:MAG: XRE family transcriptional regulator [Deltaproteobacteria bacterium]|nr:XRE family transcriptional regulator [Deltaproteobacteria bacterium]
MDRPGKVITISRERVGSLLEKLEIRKELVALRRKRGLTQKDLADRMGVSQPVVAELEAGRASDVRLSTILRAAMALGAKVKISLEAKE